MKCNFCDKQIETKPTKTGKQRTPNGWHVHSERTYCNKCWHAAFIMRAITFPVAGPVSELDQKEAWQQLRQSLAKGWGQVTSLSNWLTAELYKQDTQRTPEQAKLAKMPSTYLYGEARERFPEIPSGLVPTIEQSVTAKYRAKRYDVIWLGEAQLPTYRYPVPYPVRKADWSAYYGTDNVPLISCNIAGTKFVLRLRGGKEFGRQLGAFAKLIKKEAIQSELAFYRQRVSESSNRNGQKDQGTQHRIMAKLCMWLPKVVSEKERSGKMVLKTDNDCLLYGVIEGRDQPWIINADQVKGWIAEHQRRRQRMSEDLKYEKRWPKEKREAMVEAQDKFCRKQRNRLDTFCRQVAASVAGFAARQHLATVVYDDSCSSYLSSFPWFDLKTKIEQKLTAINVEFSYREPNKTVTNKKKKGKADCGNSASINCGLKSESMHSVEFVEMTDGKL
jgi:hypothetical protein